MIGEGRDDVSGAPLLLLQRCSAFNCCSVTFCFVCVAIPQVAFPTSARTAMEALVACKNTEVNFVPAEDDDGQSH